MAGVKQTFEERKETALRAARAQGIVDVVSATEDGVSLDTVELATKLMEKHGPSIYADLEKRRKKQV